MADQNEEDTTPAADIVVTKYKMAGDMVNGERDKLKDSVCFEYPN